MITLGQVVLQDMFYLRVTSASPEGGLSLFELSNAVTVKYHVPGARFSTTYEVIVGSSKLTTFG